MVASLQQRFIPNIATNTVKVDLAAGPGRGAKVPYDR
jgi:hypothetical protein